MPELVAKHTSSSMCYSSQAQKAHSHGAMAEPTLQTLGCGQVKGEVLQFPELERNRQDALDTQQLYMQGWGLSTCIPRLTFWEEKNLFATGRRDKTEVDSRERKNGECSSQVAPAGTSILDTR